jgi:hypothetical protein
MKFTIFASLFACAAAFAPVSQKSSSTALSMSFENELGAQAPLGFWGKFLRLKCWQQSNKSLNDRIFLRCF